ncbi:hypothetical protein R3X25_00605 [Lutibacter sp. TH_r2]|uniref:hypothetical protein n=1 Tax=Lutibacter sp. TH_r2 TaxID=3082083 RepID=UPI0029543C74|nr:hypothetical protein [Lutibacter sp. TH_r2]MDV7185765.1 hypothetical protein [Lutibacter sp. TH_r2]
MKKIFNLFVVFSLLFISCNDNEDFNTEDMMTGTAAEGGVIVAVNSNSTGKLLGVPSSTDFETATISFAASELDLGVLLMSGGADIATYEIVKSINGGTEASVATSSTLPISLVYTTVDDYIDGLGITADDLRIGDVITFKTKMTKSDGSVIYAGPNDGSYSITVSCSSDLAGTYDLTMVSSNGYVINFPNEEITEVSPGYYKTTSIYAWSVGSIAPDQGFNFSDVCGQLNVPDQDLAQGYYSNDVFNTEAGYVDGATGDLKIFYTVSFSSGDVTCVGTYTKK